MSLGDLGPEALVPELPEPETMDKTALVFLDDPLARRLAVAWKACHGNLVLWFTAAGLPTSQRADARELGTALRMNGICRKDGVVDELALQYIAARAMEPIAKRMNRGKSRRR